MALEESIAVGAITALNGGEGGLGWRRLGFQHYGTEFWLNFTTISKSIIAVNLTETSVANS